MKLLHNLPNFNDKRLGSKRINPVVISFVERITTVRFQVLLLLMLALIEYGILVLTKGSNNFVQFILFHAIDAIVFFFYVHYLFPLIAKSRLRSAMIGILIISSLIIHIGMHFTVYVIFLKDIQTFVPKFPVFLGVAFHRSWQRLILSVFLWCAYIIKESARREQVMENNNLYSRISPHLIFNVLNMLPSTNEQPLQNDKLIGLLSQYSRNAMEELAEDGKWPLRTEINQLEILLQINELRFGDIYISIEKDLPTNLEDFRVPPSIVITLAENIFKYGVVNKADKPVLISLKFLDNDFVAELANHKDRKVNISSTKTGIENVRKRLENIYGNNYSFAIEDDESVFKAKLRFPIS